MPNIDRFEDVMLLEMADESSIDIPFDSNLDIEEITADDEHPMFVIVEVLRNTLSLNKRRYSTKNVVEVSEQIIGKPAYLGHANPNGVGWEFREPHALFVGSITEQIDNKLRCLAKAYLFKTSELREWLPKTLKAGNPLQVSLSAKASGYKQGEEIIISSITELESVDFCNSGTAGVPTSLVLNVTEMLEKGDLDMDRAEVIASLTIEEIQSCPNYNEAIPEQITEISLVIDEEAENVPLTEVQTKINEIKSRPYVVNVELDGQMKTLTGDEITNTITELYANRNLLQAKIDEIYAKQELDRIKAYKESKVFEMFGEKQGAIVLDRITGETEEAIDGQIAEMKTFIDALNVNVVDNPVPPHNHHTSREELQSKVNSLFQK